MEKKNSIPSLVDDLKTVLEITSSAINGQYYQLHSVGEAMDKIEDFFSRHVGEGIPAKHNTNRVHNEAFRLQGVVNMLQFRINKIMLACEKKCEA